MPTAYVLYHFFYPDDVISAVLFSQFAEELSRRGWDVTVISSNRYCRYPDRVILKKREIWKKVTIIRTYRPKFNQANSYLRLLNSLWMILAWTNQLLVMPEADAIIIGTDPQFSAFIFPLLRFFRRGKVLVHWVYDIFPEAIIADNPPRIYRYFLSILKRLTKFSYQFVDATVDIGPCMREILRNQYPACNNRATLVPWALAEPDKLLEPEQKTREEMFGNARLGLLYSGSLGRAHDYKAFLELARNLNRKDEQIAFNFGCRGLRERELRLSVGSLDKNVKLSSFVNESMLEKRLCSADILLVSLRPGWEGIFVPSKFFGALAMGKPVLYAGSEDSDIGEWIRKFNVGWILKEDNLEEIADILMDLARDKQKLRLYQEKAFRVYQTHFSKKVIMDDWAKLLNDAISNSRQ